MPVTDTVSQHAWLQRHDAMNPSILFCYAVEVVCLAACDQQRQGADSALATGPAMRQCSRVSGVENAALTSSESLA